MATEFFDLGRDGFWNSWHIAPLGSIEICDALKDFTYSGLKGPFPYPLTLRGSQPLDIMTHQFTNFINSNVHDLFLKNKFTGWDCFQVNIRSQKKVKFSGLSILGRATVENCTWDPEEGCTTGFDLASWDGSDFFRLGNKPIFLVTGKVAEVLINEKITGVKLVPIDPKGTKVS